MTRQQSGAADAPSPAVCSRLRAPAADAPRPIQLALLIDDEEIDQMMYQRVIARSDMVEELVCFHFAEEALRFLQQDNTPVVDVIFLDINMPRMNGFEFLQAATDLVGTPFAKLCVVMLTTSLSPGDKARAHSFDMVRDFINKPLTLDDIRNVVDLLDQQS